MELVVKKKDRIMYQTSVPEGVPEDKQILDMRENGYVTYVEGKVYNPAKKKKPQVNNLEE